MVTSNSQDEEPQFEGSSSLLRGTQPTGVGARAPHPKITTTAFPPSPASGAQGPLQPESVFFLACHAGSQHTRMFRGRGGAAGFHTALFYDQPLISVLD